MTFWKRHMLKSEEVLTTVGNRKILRDIGTVLYLHIDFKSFFEIVIVIRILGGLVVKNPPTTHGFDPWVRKIP